MYIEIGDNEDSQVCFFFNGMVIYLYVGFFIIRCDVSIMYFFFDKYICELNFLSYEYIDWVIFFIFDFFFNFFEYINKEWEV